jgi:hypothetical protein
MEPAGALWRNRRAIDQQCISVYDVGVGVLTDPAVRITICIVWRRIRIRWCGMGR